METISVIILSAIVSVIVLICFFVLCANVAKLVKALPGSDYEEYLICEKMGDKNKAYYHLMRSVAKDALKGINEYDISDYAKKFEALGLGLPEMDIFNNYKKQNSK